MNNDLVGTQLGKYEIQAEIGRGGMGTVYKGYDPALDRYVAVKVLAPHLVWKEKFIERFLREARAAARLDHPGLVTIYEVNQKGDSYYFVMQYLEGQPLDETIRQRGMLPSKDVLAILHSLAEALDYAHHRGLVHRDIKPANIIVSPEGRVTLTDFGIARAAQETSLTTTGTVLGTPKYMSPEQAKGLTVSARSDQYSLAVVIYEMLSGQVPFDAESTLALLHKIVYEPPPSIRRARPDLPAEVEQVLAKALAKQPGDRYSTVSAFANALGQALAGEGMKEETTEAAQSPVEAPAMVRESEAEATPMPRRASARGRVPVWIWALGGVAVLALVMGVVMALRGGGDQATSPTRVAGVATATAASVGILEETAQPSRAPSPTATRQPTRTPVSIPSPTPTPSPFPTSTPVPSPTPMPTPVPSPTPCTVAVHGAFSSVWQANTNRLGCPLSASKGGVWMAQEDFQRGRMFWREDNGKIYVLYSNGRWERYDDIWHEGEVEFTCGTTSSPPTPKRGFGKIWCTYDNVRQGLGDATNAEGGEHGTVQEFNGGLILQTGSGRACIFFSDGTWRQ